MFKEINIKIEDELSIEERNKLLEFIQPCIDDKFIVNIENDEVKIELNSLDFEKLILLNNQFINECNNEKLVLLANKILDNISNIKNYGLKGGKRIYVDYNKERKVVNRKLKENKRQQFYYTKGNDFSQINNLIPIDYENKIICDDSLNV